MTSFVRLTLAITGLLASMADALVACSCPEPYVGLVETGKAAPIVVTARVLSYQPVDDSKWPAESPYIVVKVVDSLKGGLAGERPIYGSGRGDCTENVKQFSIGGTFVFVLFDQADGAAGGKPGFGLFGICRAVSARVRGGEVEGVLRTVPRDERTDTRMSIQDFRRAIARSGTPGIR